MNRYVLSAENLVTRLRYGQGERVDPREALRRSMRRSGVDGRPGKVTAQQRPEVSRQRDHSMEV